MPPIVSIWLLFVWRAVFFLFSSSFRLYVNRLSDDIFTYIRCASPKMTICMCRPTMWEKRSTRWKSKIREENRYFSLFSVWHKNGTNAREKAAHWEANVTESNEMEYKTGETSTIHIVDCGCIFQLCIFVSFGLMIMHEKFLNCFICLWLATLWRKNRATRMPTPKNWNRSSSVSFVRCFFCCTRWAPFYRNAFGQGKPEPFITRQLHKSFLFKRQSCFHGGKQAIFLREKSPQWE